MDWKDCGDEGFMIEQDGHVSMIMLSPDDMIQVAAACLEGELVLSHDDEPFLVCDDERDLTRLARDLLDAALSRDPGNRPRLVH